MQHKATVCQLLSRGDEWRCVHFIGISNRNSTDFLQRCRQMILPIGVINSCALL